MEKSYKEIYLEIVLKTCMRLSKDQTIKPAERVFFQQKFEKTYEIYLEL